MASAPTRSLIVWEWEDELFCWRPYEPHISNFIEQNQTTRASLNLGPADIKFKQYDIDFNRSVQIRNNTGTQRRIERHLYPEHSPVGSGVVWQYEGDHPGTWQPYASVFSDVLENAYQNNKNAKLDLSVMPPYMPYKIDLKKMTQTRNETGRKRKIQRKTRANPVQYLVDPSAAPATAIFGPASGHMGSTSGSHFGSTSGGHAGSTSGGHTGSSFGGIGGIFHTVTGALSSKFGSHHSGPGAHHSGHGAHNAGSTHRMAHTMAPSHGSHGNNPNGFVAMPPAAKNMKSGSSGAAAMGSSSAATGAVTRSKVHKSGGGAAGVRASAPPGYYSGSLSPSGGAIPKTAKPFKPLLPERGQFSNNTQTHAKANKKKKSKDHEFDDILRPVMKVLHDPPKDEDCCICMSSLRENSGIVDEKHSIVIKLKCDHMFHKSCLKAMYDSGHKDNSLQCPSCKIIYGIKFGICPAGTMTYDTLDHSLPGYEGYKTIRVVYDIKPGIQGAEHPHTGQRYHTQGFPRIGFLPNTEQGQKVLKLLIKAWERRLTFTVGQSATTGAQNMVVWNGIHHKTEMVDMSGHGYPAPNYLDNVKLECADLGVYETEDEEEMEEGEGKGGQVWETSSNEDTDL